MESIRLERSYGGYHIHGSAQSIFGESGQWYAVATVTLLTPKHTVVQVYRFQDSEALVECSELAAWFGLWLAELAVDHFVPAPAYYLTPMHAAWAVDIVRRAAGEFMEREVRVAKLYEALDYLVETLDKAWVVKRYRYELRGDCRDWRDRKEKQYKLRVTARGIQLACAAQLVERMNELATRYGENRAKIDRLRQALFLIKSGSRHDVS